MSLKTKIIKQKEHVYLAELKGSLDSDTYLQLEDELKEIIDERTSAVILDLKALTYISSAGIRSVMWAKKTLAKNSASFAMVNLKPQIEKVFDAMKILPIMDVFHDMPEVDKYIDNIIKTEVDKQNS